jgi:ketosteroid isomerase-like protein
MLNLMLAAVAAAAISPDDAAVVGQLDRDYQAAVKRNDAETMERILDPRFQLVLGSGQKASREDLLRNARERSIVYELQDEEAGSQSVMVAGDTAIVTAKLLLKGINRGERFGKALWFSDTYVRTPGGWRYLFGQASLPLPVESP